jgi:peptidyl-prolyl cis-trans isomerase A (cyclophilin A)
VALVSKLGGIVLGLMAASCGGKGQETPGSGSGATATTATTATVLDSAAPPSGDFRNPASADMKAEAPAEFQVRFETSRGDFVLLVHRDWAPLGADRFYNLARSGYFDGVRFFRVLTGFVAQFGMHGDPGVGKAWFDARIADDPVKHSNTRGTITFATAGPNTRTTQLFINFGNNNMLDGQGFAPFGEVIQGMDVVDALHAGYGEGPPRGRGPDQGRIRNEGNAYLEKDFPQLDYVKSARILTKLRRHD